MPNTYIDIESVKGTGVLNLTGTAYDARLRILIEGVSREVDSFCNRQFYYVVETRTYSGPGSARLYIPDLVSIPGSGIKEDANLDGTFDTVWADADYIKAPYNAEPTSTWGMPYTWLEVNTKSDGSQDEFVKGQQNYQITGTWGYNKVTVDSGQNGTLANGTSTALNLTGTGTIGTMGIGHTLLIDDEQVYVRGTSGTSTLLVDRGINGSTATAHTNRDVNIIVYPGPVQEAVIIQASRLWQRRHSGFANQVGFPETGQMMVFRGGLDGDVKQLLSGYRRLTV